MPKPFLAEPMATLEREIIHTLIVGLKEWRSDLSYPESYSDMQACARALIKMFGIERRPLPVALDILCSSCRGGGQSCTDNKGGINVISRCVECNGTGKVLCKCGNCG